MKNHSIKIKINNPEELDLSRRRYSITAAKIIFNKIPAHLLNSFIKSIETKDTMNNCSL